MTNKGFMKAEIQKYSAETGRVYKRTPLIGWSCHNDKPKTVCFVLKDEDNAKSAYREQILIPLKGLVAELKKHGLV